MSAWMWGGVGLAVAAGAWFIGLGSVASVLRSIMGALADWVRYARRWLSIPGNKMRMVFIGLALGFLAAGLQSWQRGTVIIQQRADYTRLQEQSAWEKEAMTGTITDLHGAVAARDRVIERFIELAEQQKDLLKVAADQAAAALSDAEHAKQAAAAAERRFQDEFDGRPPECEAALQVMARACPTLKGY